MNKTQHIRPGFKQSPLGPIPIEWEVKKVCECGKVFTGNTPPTKDINNYGTEYLFVSPNDLGLSKYITKTGKKLSEKGFNISRKFPIGSLLFTCIGSTIGKSGIASEDLTSNQQINAIIVNENNSNEFIYYQLSLNAEKIKLLAGEQAVPILNKSQFESIKILIPNLIEQNAIANLLSTWDKAIETTQKLITQKKLRKKWLMQMLLTGKKRVKGFCGKWKEYYLGSLGSTYTGLTGKSKEDFGSGKPYIPYLNIFNNAKIDKSNFDYVTINEKEKQNEVKYGDIFFTISSETPDEVGMASVLLDNINELYLNSFCFGFRLKNFLTIDPNFSSYYFRSDIFREKISRLSQGATRYNLSKNSLMKLSVILPQIEEQSVIGLILLSAEKEIGLLNKRLDKLKEQKKGLMRVLLTGKRRLKLI